MNPHPGVIVNVYGTGPPVTVAALLRVTLVPAMAVMVVPAGMPGPLTPVPTVRPVDVLTTITFDPVVVLAVTVGVRLGGRPVAVHDVFGTCVVPASAPVQGAWAETCAAKNTAASAVERCV